MHAPRTANHEESLKKLTIRTLCRSSRLRSQQDEYGEGIDHPL
jgi:hypothetical protein